MKTPTNGVVVSGVGREGRFGFAFDDVDGERRARHRVVGAIGRENRRGINDLFQKRCHALILLLLQFGFASQRLFVDFFDRLSNVVFVGDPLVTRPFLFVFVAKFFVRRFQREERSDNKSCAVATSDRTTERKWRWSKSA